LVLVGQIFSCLNRLFMAEQQPWWLPGVRVFIEATGLIVVPLFIALLLGNFIDQYLVSQPWGLMISISIAFVITFVALAIKAKQAIRQL